MKRIEFAAQSEGNYTSYDVHREEEGSFLELLLPPAAAPLILLLLLVSPLVFLTAKSLFIPLYNWAQYHLMSMNGEVTSGELPNYYFIKLTTFVVLAFLGGFQLLLRIKSIYYTTWARLFPRPHSLHVNYQRDSSRGMIALIQWKLYQVALIILPPLLITIFTGFVALAELYVFNTFSDLSFIGMSVQLTIELFLIMMLGLFTFFSFLNSGWTALSSIFGDVVAVTEPDLANPIIMQRCGRIAFSSPGVYLLFAFYLLLVGIVVAEVSWLVGTLDIYQLISLQGNPLLIMGVEALTLAVYLGFNFLKFFLYHRGLIVYYDKLPSQLKECFSPPP